MTEDQKKELLLAILAMDSYNEGYDKGLDHGAIKIGSATLKDDPEDSIITGWKSVGFYAAAYRLADGSTVISYRGTDGLDPFAEGNDILNGWVAGGVYLFDGTSGIRGGWPQTA